MRSLLAIVFSALVCLCAQDQLIRILEVPAHHRGTFVITHVWQSDAPGPVQRLTLADFQRPAVLNEIRVAHNGVVLAAGPIIFEEIHRSGGMVMGSLGTEILVLGTFAADPSYRMYVLVNTRNSSRLVMLAR